MHFHGRSQLLEGCDLDNAARYHALRYHALCLSLREQIGVISEHLEELATRHVAWVQCRLDILTIQPVLEPLRPRLRARREAPWRPVAELDELRPQLLHPPSGRVLCRRIRVAILCRAALQRLHTLLAKRVVPHLHSPGQGDACPVCHRGVRLPEGLVVRRHEGPWQQLPRDGARLLLSVELHQHAGQVVHGAALQRPSAHGGRHLAKVRLPPALGASAQALGGELNDLSVREVGLRYAVADEHQKVRGVALHGAALWLC
mmetsp:Transcript_15234/g.38699  ORF Transcript_15234/g.38699 Transcript_15234/m.38699 type:complete len:260 (-) Transcript_15234:716-1495(-)